MKKIKLYTVRNLILLLLTGIGFSLLTAYIKGGKQELKPGVVKHSSQYDDDEELSTGHFCLGLERWSVKVFTDLNNAAIDFNHPHNSSIAHLVSLPTVTPWIWESRIQPQEDSVYTVVCNILEVRPELDSDYHLVISDGTNTMVAEIPCPGCSSVDASSKISDFIAARQWAVANLGTVLDTNVNIPPVQITGVSFYDLPHFQVGKAPNNMEIHSIIKIGYYQATGTEEITANPAIKVYPNPCNGVFNISLIKLNNNPRVEVFNIYGQLVYQSALPADVNHIALNSPAEGIYMYRVLTEKGNSLREGKILIEKP